MRGVRGYARWWDAAIGSLLLLTVLTRLPFRSHVPINWDAVQYILSLQRFDIAAHQPHPPGNPLYVVLGRGAHVLLPDPNQALIALSILASVVVVWGTARLGARLADRRVGLWAAGLVAVNPLLWFYGETALPYAPEAAAGTLLALAAWHARVRPSRSAAVWLGLAAALAGGLRPTVLPLLGLVWLFGLGAMSWRRRALAAGVTALGCLAWAVPLIVLSGGPLAYWTQLRRLTQAAVEPTSLLSGPSLRWLGNLGSVGAAAVVMLHLFAVVVVVALVRQRGGLCWWPLSLRAQVLWAWLVPPLLMFTLVHFGQWGYLLLVLPPATILGLLALARAGMLAGRAGAARLGAAALAGALIFLATPPLGPAGVQFAPTRSDLVAHDAAWATVVRLVAVLPPSETLVLTSADGRESYRIASYLLPGYEVWGVGRDWSGNWGSLYEAVDGHADYALDPLRYAHGLVRVANVKYIVVLDKSLVARVPDPTAWERLELPNGAPLLVRSMAPVPAYLSFADREIRILTGSALRAPVNADAEGRQQ
ncbi:MAG: glycosyltransferase family 39 protein [Sphaerobacter sp.]|nr:glycosyltransferase family 39 protein [Sphaerobacter sp.]